MCLCQHFPTLIKDQYFLARNLNFNRKLVFSQLFFELTYVNTTPVVFTIYIY